MRTYHDQPWRQELDQTSQAIAAARVGFNQTSDDDLLEYYLYESSALRAKYSYLLRRVKGLGGGE